MDTGSFQIHHPINSATTLSLEPKSAFNQVTLHVKEIEDVPHLKFLSLPREIRDQVYNLIFHSKTPIYPSKARAGISEFLGLLRVNRQTYAEAIQVFYGSNTFQVRGDPSWMSVDFLFLLIMQRRESFILSPSTFCLARHHLRRLIIPSHGINLKILKHIFSLLKFFPNLEHLRVVFLGAFGVQYMDVVSVCRLLRDRRPLFGNQIRNMELWKRFNYHQAEDISWMVSERPYKVWRAGLEEHEWRSDERDVRIAKVVDAPQMIPE
ncbi:hypothetical protein LSUE1_G008572 [Lachnellula suecica]|uniref:F-box domain-containing protein n=1 Tax=Lachnellula suecica TaxID=602035 RepID=A0A8T9BT04_9HELO|nr:hypothetical protein LSUE1_G008572 [Lachnellula suecica]